MPTEVTDPALLAQLNTPQEVTDPALLAQLNGSTKPASAFDRMQAFGSGVTRGGAYLATSIPDAAINLFNLGKVGMGYGYSKFTGKAPPKALEAGEASPLGADLSQWLDNNVAPTQPDRPEDAASRYLSTAGSVIPGAATGGGLVSGAKAALSAAPPAMAGQAVAEAHPFQSEAANTAASVAAQALGGWAMPRGRGPDVPGNAVRNQTVRAAQDAGMVFPPATTNPSTGNRLIENLAGKQQVQQHATITNRDAVNKAARTDLSLPGKGGISESEINGVQREANQHYEAIRQIGTVATGSDPSFVSKMQAALAKYTGAGRVLTRSGTSGLQQDVQDVLSHPHSDANDLVDTISVLRDRSKAAFKSGDAGIGAAYRQASNAIEDQLEKGAMPPPEKLGPDGALPQPPQTSKLIEDFQAARRRLAIAHTVEDARNEGSGDINPQKLAGMLSNNVPLSGNLLTAAKAASLSPKAFAPVTDSKGVNHLGLWGGVLGGAALGHELAPSWGLAPAAIAGGLHAGRLGARMYALGPGQKNAIDSRRAPMTYNTLLANYLSSQALKNQ